jgi:hypothetical protein
LVDTLWAGLLVLHPRPLNPWGVAVEFDVALKSAIDEIYQASAVKVVA